MKKTTNLLTMLIINTPNIWFVSDKIVNGIGKTLKCNRRPIKQQLSIKQQLVRERR
jgi:hypothetical protein